MSANPYGGVGYYTGMIQAMSGQLRGEAEADRLAQAQANLEAQQLYKQQVAQQEAQEAMQAQAWRQKTFDADQAFRGRQEDRLQEGQKLDWFKALGQKYGRGSGRDGLTPQQQLAFTQNQAKAMVERGDLNTAFSGIRDQMFNLDNRDEEIEFALPGQAPMKMPAKMAMDYVGRRIKAIDQMYPQNDAVPQPQGQQGQVVAAPGGAPTVPAQPLTPAAKIPPALQKRVMDTLALLQAKGQLYNARELAMAAKTGDLAKVAGLLDGAGYTDRKGLRVGEQFRENMKYHEM